MQHRPDWFAGRALVDAESQSEFSNSLGLTAERQIDSRRRASARRSYQNTRCQATSVSA